MFDLEQQIQEWRHRVLAALTGRAEVIDELESHLREEVQHLLQSGQQLPDAWAMAMSRLGTPQQLAGEFRKLPPPAEAWLPGRAVLVAFTCIMGLVVWMLLTKLLEGLIEPLLAVHVLTVMAGYLAVFTVGTLAAWSLLIRTLRGWDERRATAFRAYAFRITLVGALFTLVAVVTGAWWARDHLGRYWAWDSKEVGGLAVLGWHVLMLAGLHLRKLVLAPQLLGVLGNIVVSLSWFAPALATHSYDRAGFALGLAGFLVMQLLFLLLGFLPERQVISRRA
jgi:hypothetical protein